MATTTKTQKQQARASRTAKPAATTPAPAETKGLPATVIAFDKKTITLVVKDNPCKPNTGHHQRFSLYKSGMKVGDYVKLGGRRGDVRYDLAHGFLKLT